MKDSAWKLRRLTVMAAVIAMSFVVSLVRVPVVLFLEFEAKDVLLAFAGFIYDPITGIICAAITSVVEFLLNSGSNDTQFFGLLMNVVSSCLFVGVSAVIYHRRRTLASAIVALVCGVFVMTAGMLLWDFFIIPLYMQGVTREAVAPLLLSAFLPFNLLKGALNAVLTMLLYKPLSSALRSARLLPPTQAPNQRKSFLPVTIVSALLLIALVLGLLAWKGII